jgi:hypothetical protein
MATITTRAAPFDLGEAHRRVRSPLARLSGYIRTYVALEGAALFCAFFAVWFWFTLVMDYGLFKLFGWDWVQSFSGLRWPRAITLGAFFALVVAVLQFPTLLPAVAREVGAGLREAFGKTPRQSVSFWVRMAGGIFGIVAVGLLSWWLGDGTAGAGFYALCIVAALIGVALISLLSVSVEELLAAAARLPELMWVRAGLGLVGLILGSIFGGVLVAYLFSEHILAVTAGAAFGAALAGMILWHLGSMLYLLIVDKQYRVLIGLPALACYVFLWLVVGAGADDDIYGQTATGFLIALLLLGPALFLAAKRLFHDFSHPALALVLERRFPKILGDRLITAVEMADPREAAKLGYSQRMVEETIQEAAQRVEKLPLGEVFDWGRLRRQAVVVLIVTLGCYIAAGGAFALGDAIGGNPSGLGSFTKLHNVSAIWAERNLLLANTIWPRRAHLEFIDNFAETDEIKIGQGDAPPTVKVRALRWVIADSNAAEGWRSMYWTDLNTEILGGAAPSVSPPGEWAERNPQMGVSLDEIELRLDKPDTHATLAADTKSTLRDILDALQERSRLPEMSRRFRVLTIPDTVYVNYKSENTRSEMTLKQVTNNEFEGQFPELSKEKKVTFYARGEDYYTKDKIIHVVPPPSLVKLLRDEYHPAYLYYRGRPEVLRGKKQLRKRDDPASLFGGDVSNIDLPAGSDIDLVGHTDKELQPGGARALSPDDKKQLSGVHVDVTTDNEGRYKLIHTRFTNVRSEIKFYFEFIDTDNVVGRRQVRIRPQEDTEPTIDAPVEYLRKTPQGYLVTPLAQIPFSGTVHDDRGLDTIEFVYQLTRSDPGDWGLRPLLMVSAMQMAVGSMGGDFLTAACLTSLAREPQKAGDGKGRSTLRTFSDRLHNRPNEYLPEDEWLPLLKKELGSSKYGQRNLLKDFKLDPEDPEVYFDLDPDTGMQLFPGRARLQDKDGRAMSLKAPQGQRQTRYRLQLWIEATDTDIETGPHRGSSKERFTFLIVPEEELIKEVAKEEENHHVKLEEAVRRLRDAEAKLTQMKLDLAVVGGVKKEQFGNMSLRAEDVEQILDQKGLTTVTEVYNDYKRILQELKLNRIQTINYITNIEKNIVGRLQESIDVDFPETDKAFKDLHKLLDGDDSDSLKKTADARAANDAALAQLTKLLNRLDEVLASMEQLTTVNKLIAALLEIEKQLGDEEIEYIRRRRVIEENIFQELEGPDKEKKPMKKPEGKDKEKKPMKKP